jgi:hypothetical protein
MSALSLQTSHALDGTMHCILPGSDPTAAPLLIGSHYDSVIDADTIGYQLSYFYRILQNKTRYRHLAAPLAPLPRHFQPDLITLCDHAIFETTASPPAPSLPSTASQARS